MVNCTGVVVVVHRQRQHPATIIRIFIYTIPNGRWCCHFSANDHYTKAITSSLSKANWHLNGYFSVPIGSENASAIQFYGLPYPSCRPLRVIFFVRLCLAKISLCIHYAVVLCHTLNHHLLYLQLHRT